MRLIDADALKQNVKYQAGICRLLNNDAMTEYANMMEFGFCKEIDNAPTIDLQPQWIPVSERLPERDHPVLVSLNNFEPHVAIDEWVGEDMFWAFGRGVKAWMPLPEPYEKRE